MSNSSSATGGSSSASRITLISALLIVAAIVLLVRALPLEALLGALKTWIAGLGPWGPAIFSLVYALWSVAFLPGSALTLAGGAIFGLAWGFVSVLAGAVLGAALSFLIGRYLARDKVRAMARRNAKFGAIDKAIGEGGWKIVAMLRLSPAMPFNVQNYLYGVTPIGFWPCVLASAVFMIPGTLMYVYLGYLGGQGLAAASGGAARSPAQWALLAVGLLATIAVTVYVTKLASKALRERTDLEESSAPVEETKAPKRPAWGLAVVAALLFAGALYANFRPGALKMLFGPPQVTMHEAYQDKLGGPTFDHSAFSALLAEYVDDTGMVDYAGLAQEHAALDAYIATLADAPFGALGRDEKLALLINAYNAFTLRLILDSYPVASIRDIPADKRWDAVRWKLAGETYSLDQIEHEQIRPKFAEPRVHFALVCAAMGCPKLRNEAYEGARLNEQLEDQTRYALSHDRWFAFDPATNTVKLTQLFNWYGGDFAQQAGSALAFAARYSPELEKALDAGNKPKIEWLDYDWSLNEQMGNERK